MNLDVLTVRRTLRAVQRGLPIPEALTLIDWILDGLDADEREQSLDELVTAALRQDTASVEGLRSQIRVRPHGEEVVYGQ
jgi:hypothetical protein